MTRPLAMIALAAAAALLTGCVIYDEHRHAPGCYEDRDGWLICPPEARDHRYERSRGYGGYGYGSYGRGYGYGYPYGYHYGRPHHGGGHGDGDQGGGGDDDTPPAQPPSPPAEPPPSQRAPRQRNDLYRAPTHPRNTRRQRDVEPEGLGDRRRDDEPPR